MSALPSVLRIATIAIPELCVYIQVLNCCLDGGSQLRLQLGFYEIPILNAGGKKKTHHMQCVIVINIVGALCLVL